MFEACLPFGPVVLEADLPAFLERLETLRGDCRKMREQIIPSFVGSGRTDTEHSFTLSGAAIR